MTAISLLTGPPQKKGKGGGGAWSQVANCKVQGWNTSASPGYSAELRKLGTLDHLDHLILGRNNAVSSETARMKFEFVSSDPDTGK